jgi:SOS-response transcriptional repressor LexA
MTGWECAGYNPHRQGVNIRNTARNSQDMHTIEMKRDGRIIIERVDARLKALGLKDNSASERTGFGRDLIRDLRRNPERSPKLETLMALARVLECSLDYLIDPDVPDMPTGQQLIQIKSAASVDIKGLVGADLWQNPRRLSDPPQLGRVKIMLDHTATEAPSYALQVVGDSMNRRAPDGSFVIIVPDEGRTPIAGEMVVVRQEQNGLVEQSLRRVQRTATGFELAPESTNATFEAIPYEPGKTQIIGRVLYIVQKPD